MSDEIKHECGICAVSLNQKKADSKALFYTYKMLLNLQNRGQLAAGFTVYNNKKAQLLDTYKGLGVVNEVFKTHNRIKSARIFQKYVGTKAIGHVRYATFGLDNLEYAQPFERKHGRLWKWFSFCFNGNLANYNELKSKLMGKPEYHMILNTDTEIVMHYTARELMGPSKPSLRSVFHNLSNRFDGAYNMAFIDGHGDLVVARDPHGFRPLSYTIKNGNALAASESNALFNCGFRDIKSLEPGKMILVRDGDIKIQRFANVKRRAYCMFEWVYFANVSSVIDNKSVYVARTKLGKELAKLETETIGKDHIVVPVPDTAKAAGDALAYELGIPSMEGLIRNRFVGRTFIEGSGRERKVENKYTVIRPILKGKKVILVDDSIVRGLTSQAIVQYLKKVGGAREVHCRISCPPVKAPCFYGIDMSTVSELLAPKFERPLNPDYTSEKTCEKIARFFGADSVIYQTIPGLVRSIGLPKGELCLACLNGKYPTTCGKAMYLKALHDAKKKGRKNGKRTYEC
jgi:amidophosphoribosyltransferase